MDKLWRNNNINTKGKNLELWAIWRLAAPIFGDWAIWQLEKTLEQQSSSQGPSAQKHDKVEPSTKVPDPFGKQQSQQGKQVVSEEEEEVFEEAFDTRSEEAPPPSKSPIKSSELKHMQVNDPILHSCGSEGATKDLSQALP